MRVHVEAVTIHLAIVVDLRPAVKTIRRDPKQNNVAFVSLLFDTRSFTGWYAFTPARLVQVGQTGFGPTIAVTPQAKWRGATRGKAIRARLKTRNNHLIGVPRIP